MVKFFNEMTADNTGSANLTREHYREFTTWLNQQAPETIQRKRAEADLLFRRVGITFAVYGDDAGTERLIPFDIIPRIIPAAEWSQLQKGLVQRVTALNMFIHDIYHDQNITMRIHRQDRRLSATATHAPSSLLWRFGTEFSAQSSSHCHGAHASDPAR